MGRFREIHKGPDWWTLHPYHEVQITDTRENLTGRGVGDSYEEAREAARLDLTHKVAKKAAKGK